MPMSTTCQQIQKARTTDHGNPLPEVEGHIFIISRDYTGPNAKPLGVGANNIPQQTMWDAARVWENIRKQLPESLRPEEEEWNERKSDSIRYHKAPDFPTTRETYTLRKDLKDLMCGPIDINTNELWLCCPTLYQRAWDNMYGEHTGYEKVYPRKGGKSLRNILLREEPQGKKKGNEKDLIKSWEKIYKQRQWQRFGPFNKKGSFNLPYILFKAKNITDHKIRQEKWKKARPIAPATKHPMRKLFHKTGRALSYITSHLESNNLIINHGGQVTEFLQHTQHKLKDKGEIQCEILDIEGCFPNMPKEAIKLGIREELQKITKAKGVDSVAVPTKKTEACTFNTRYGRGWTTIPFEDLLDVMEFALDNTIFKDRANQLWRQCGGIPMGDPHSPGMCIGACAWMEHEWLECLDNSVKTHISARRYMDDVIMFYAKNDTWDTTRFLNDARNECYFPPLKLEPGAQGTFLETSFAISETNDIEFWLKNENYPGKDPKTWRYAHYLSHGTAKQKYATMKACLGKVNKMASNEKRLKESAYQKIIEFIRLRYPANMIKDACKAVAVKTRNATWFRIGEAI